MFEIRPDTFAPGFAATAYVNHASLLNRSISLFYQSRQSAALAKLKASLLRRSQALFDLGIIPANLVQNQHYGGIRAVSIEKICGSLGRSADFDRQFHPLSDRIQGRWVNIAMARAQNLPLAPVELIQIGEWYFVKDGHHRISVAQALGETVLDAEIVVWDITCTHPRDVQPAVRIMLQLA